ncbi:low molecular weight protein-tyrosine-phosphatase [Jannaschia seohaensis]|uniref:protein-tyrosine-phosphatase n=1 Tax=Jannaschia seohaensis TaxID=475081 RepID=A0A2Y9B7C3_9RHOB|nr:low molecular weight protein-tyrosine-phosphatase [Jannaschia seohaensis]PWJ14383.1 protein-tyrosine phosphatase [Jannaschia seohaensis]SSA50089.1 protein-tyrosine phosphatase [Jannaschia seohaensis]
MRILFVCLGNICRSAAAEGAARACFPDWEIDSAGTGGWHVGDPPYGPMIAAARARGLDLTAQRARQVRPEDFTRFDRVLAMDRAVLRDLRAMAGGDAAELFLEAAGLGARDVPDPYYTRDFQGCLDLVEAGVARLG